MSTRGGMTVSAIMPMMSATGGRMVCARSPNTCKSGRPASNTVPSTSVRTGNRVMPSSVMTGIAWASPLLSISTNCMSIGSMVGQLSRMVLNRLSMTGGNRLPASALNSRQTAGAVGRRLLDFLGLPQQGIHADLGQSSIVHFVYLVS